MVPCVGYVFGQRVIDADPEVVQHTDGRPGGWPHDGAQEPRTLIWREGLAHDGSGDRRSQLDRVNDGGVAAFGNAGMTCGAEVADPADLAEGRLHEPPIMELHHRDRRAVQLAARPATYRKQRVGPPGRPTPRYRLNTGLTSRRAHAPCMNTIANRDTTAALIAWRIDRSYGALCTAAGDSRPCSWVAAAAVTVGRSTPRRGRDSSRALPGRRLSRETRDTHAMVEGAVESSPGRPQWLDPVIATDSKDVPPGKPVDDIAREDVLVPRRCDDPAPLLAVRQEFGSDLDGRLVYQYQGGAPGGVQVPRPVDRPVRVAEIPALVDSQEAEKDDAGPARSAPGHDQLNDVAEPDPLRPRANERLKARDNPVEEAKREAPEGRHLPSIGGWRPRPHDESVPAVAHDQAIVWAGPSGNVSEIGVPRA